MTIKYRVDRSKSPKNVPCGMNSILYFGTKYSEAKRIYDASSVGVDTWGDPNPEYGIILSAYNRSPYFEEIELAKGFKSGNRNLHPYIKD